MTPQLETLLKKLDEQVTNFDREANKHKRLYRTFRYCAFGLTACSTALAGAALCFPDFQTPLNFAIVVVTAVAGLLASIEGLRKPAELWIIERRGHHALERLQIELAIKAAGDPNGIDVSDYSERLLAIIAASSQQWGQQVGQQGQVPPKEKNNGQASTPKETGT